MLKGIMYSLMNTLLKQQYDDIYFGNRCWLARRRKINVSMKL